MKLSLKLDRLKRAAPHRSDLGQLYRTERETKRRYKRITLHTLFISEENTHLLRDHEFTSATAKSPSEWNAYLGEKLADIHRNSILPGLAVRTGKAWSVQRIIGWVGNAVHKTRNSRVARGRGKAKSRRRKNG